MEEDEQIIGHARDPYTRIDTLRTRRHIHISAAGEVIAESREAMVLFESGLEPRYYLPRADVRAELLDSDTHTICPYKGVASYHSVRLADGEVLEDVAWYYPEPTPEASRVAGLICFLTEKLELSVSD